MAKVLFEVTEDNMETGMRGIPVGYCVTSRVDPQKGLFYGEYPVSDAAHWTPMEVIYLLVHGKKGSNSDVSAFSKEISKRAQCSEALVDSIQRLPREGHPMKLFSAALLLAGVHEGTGDYREDQLNLIAKVPQIVATLINYHAGWGETPKSQPELGYMANFSNMVQAPDVDKKQLAQVFRLFNVLHYDHGGGNLSAFSGKAIASGLEDLYGSLAGAMCALAGPRHGKANQDCLEFVKEMHGQVGDDPTEEQVEKVVRDRLANKQLLFGFGHAVLRVEDPRATLESEIAAEMFPNHPLVKLVSILRRVGPKVLSENPKISNPYPNVDLVSGTLMTAAGFPYPEYYTVLFGMARVVGIGTQIVYERTEARDGKGLPIVRPKYFYRER